VANLNTLIDYRYRQHFKAQAGQGGMGRNRSGADGADMVIAVPPGTEVLAEDQETLLAEVMKPGERARLAKGGNGGFGNAHFKSSTNRAPRHANPGQPGEELTIWLRLKLIADAGLVGLPNAGKSTFLATVSAAKPKIADYPFTTLVPNLGMVRLSDERSFVVADVPGLIKGASLGHGLGHQFLRHIERTKVLVHLVDVSSASGRDPVEDFDTIRDELQFFDPGVFAKPQLTVASKIDALDEPERLTRLEAHVTSLGLPFMRISAVTGEGLPALLEAVWQIIEANRTEEAASDVRERHQDGAEDGPDLLSPTLRPRP
jgi:GTP-binding protein